MDQLRHQRSFLEAATRRLAARSLRRLRGRPSNRSSPTARPARSPNPSAPPRRLGGHDGRSAEQNHLPTCAGPARVRRKNKQRVDEHAGRGAQQSTTSSSRLARAPLAGKRIEPARSPARGASALSAILIDPQLRHNEKIQLFRVRSTLADNELPVGPAQQQRTVSSRTAGSHQSLRRMRCEPGYVAPSAVRAALPRPGLAAYDLPLRGHALQEHTRHDPEREHRGGTRPAPRRPLPRWQKSLHAARDRLSTARSR